MNTYKDNYRIFDWEGIKFPIKLTEINSITNHYNIPADSSLEVFRDKDYRLKGVLKGITNNPNNFEYREHGEIKESGFINDETLKAKSNNIIFTITGFGISHVSETPFKQNDQVLFNFECQVYLYDIGFLPENIEVPKIICDFFLCSLPKIYFSGMTERINKTNPCKYRRTLDQYERSDDDLRVGSSSTWDFTMLNFQEEKIIIQSVDNDLLPDKIDGVLIEYRNATSNYPNDNFRKIVQEYFSFILGTHLQKIGTSTFDYGYELKSYSSNNPWSRKIYRNGNINPVPLKNGIGDREFFKKMINKLFPSFHNQYKEISLSDCLWKLWIGQDLPIGTNLPILSSGLETLIDSYLKKNNLLPKYSKEQKKQYNNLVKDELHSIEQKLNDFQFKNSVISKIKNPYNLSVGEKMQIFFNHISFRFDKKSIENQALIARNLMAHQGLTLDTLEEQRKVKKISDAYVSLINRVILKLLGYDWYYIDYSKEGIHYLKIEENL